MSGTYWVNEDSNTVVVQFRGAPAESVRTLLKSSGFKYNSRSRRWRAPLVDECEIIARQVAKPGRGNQQQARNSSERADTPDQRQGRLEQSCTTGNRGDKDSASYGNAALPNATASFKPNDEQRYIIEHVDGPMLVVAGPGTGKTATIVERVVHLVANRGVDPSEIAVVTYTRKAARQLVSRIAGAFAERGIPVNLDQMRVSTFHSLCLGILREYGQTPGTGSLSVIGSFAEKHRMVEDWKDFWDLGGEKVLTNRKGKPLFKYDLAKEFASIYSTAVEEHADVKSLAAKVQDEGLAVVADYLEKYKERFGGTSQLTYADIQARTIELLEHRPDVLVDLQEKIRYIIVDEYQDANNIQEELVMAFAGDRGNVCVVGDDDQSLYRFRGANVETILRFGRRFDSACDTVRLETNYRSQPGIIEFCNAWMRHCAFDDGNGKSFTWGQARMPKKIVARKAASADTFNPVSVVSCTGKNKQDWYARMVELVRSLEENPEFADYNQIAFIFPSVREPVVKGLISAFEDAGIPVYAPRAGMFAERREVQLAIGCILKCLAQAKFTAKTNRSDQYWNDYSLYADCIAVADGELQANPKLAKWVEEKAVLYSGRRDYSEQAFLRLFIEMLQHEPFATWIRADGSIALADTMQARNLAQLARLIRAFESFMESRRSDGKRDALDYLVKQFFDSYFFNLKNDSDLSEAEDDEDFAPSGHVSFMTAHQAKGLEFPVVVACSLYDEPRPYVKSYSDIIRDEAVGRENLLEEESLRPAYDFWRQYYTVFSRAQDLLVLTSMTEVPGEDVFGSGKKTVCDPSPCFRGLYDKLPDIGSIDLRELHLHAVRLSYARRTYSFTGNITPFMRCPKAYRLHKELGFPAMDAQSLLFGTLVHRSVEEIHRRVLERNGYVPSDGDIGEIVSATRAEMEAEGGTLVKSDIEQACAQVKNYLDGNRRIWQNVREAEYGVSMLQELPDNPRGGYILKGQIDLIVGEGDQVEILDFKTGQAYKDEQLPVNYQQQMAVYTHLLREKGVDVHRASIYFTGAGNSRHALQTCDVSCEQVKEVMSQVDSVVARIEAGDFSEAAATKKTCTQCLFRDWCGK